MKKNAELKDKNTPAVRVDPSLNKYSNVVLFPKKLEKAKQAFEKFGMPKQEDFSR